MNYYQKYQKYKFKYLNLLSLNQFGGSYTDEEFEIQLKNTTQEGYLIDITEEDKLAKCSISHEPVHKDYAVLLDSYLYDVNNLRTWINKSATVPHTRRSLIPKELKEINDKSKHNSVEYNISLLKTYFGLGDLITMNHLIKSYKHLSDDKTTEDEIIRAVKEDYRSIVFVKHKRITDKVIKTFEEKNPTKFFLQFIPKLR